MRYDEVLNRLTSTGFFSKSAGLSRMETILAHFGNPEESLKVIHVAGTNGKGSVCAMLHGILTEAGYKTGLYTSPYIHDFRERIQINGEMIPKRKLSAIAEEVFAFTDTLPERPNQFELITVIALLYFSREKCDFVVLETGLGGTFDATNVVKAPVLTVIMNIGLDHCEVLGNTITEIAGAKAGILKPGCNAMFYPSGKEALTVLTKRADKIGAPYIIPDLSELSELKPVSGFEHFKYKGHSYKLNLLGKHQMRNAAVAIEAAGILKKKGIKIPADAVKSALAKISWPVRMELVHRNPDVYIDGGHNPQCIAAVEEFFRDPRFAGRNVHILTGMLGDKDYRTMTDILKKFSEDVYFFRFPHKRAIPEEKMTDFLAEFRLNSTDNPEETLRRLCNSVPKNDIILCVGSLYMTDRLRTFFFRHS